MELIQKFSQMCDNFPYDFSNDEARRLAVTNYMTLFNLCKERRVEFYPVISKRIFFHSLQLDRKLNTKPKLIIFDKDGTLMRDNDIFGDWFLRLLDSLSHLVDDRENFSQSIGYDLKRKKIIPGSPLHMHSERYLMVLICKMIPNCSLTQIEKIFNETPMDWNKIEEITDTKKLLTNFKHHGLKIGICTSDCLQNTEKFIQKYDLSDLIDHIVTSDTKNIRAKPSPDPILLTCDKLNVSPLDTWMIGDTYADTHSGINACCGMIFGVSNSENKNFLSEADVIVETPEEALTQFLSFRRMC